jgi:putative SOS response-associated peptidase YedK
MYNLVDCSGIALEISDTNRLTWDEIVRLYRLTMKAPPHNLPPRYNICPTDPVDVVTEREGSRDFVRMRWGLVPSWWPKPLKELKACVGGPSAAS